MKTAEKLGRTAWISYLIAASPIALFCAAMWIGCLLLLSRESIEPLEAPPTPMIERVLITGSFIAFPIVWILGITIAHRFNEGRLVIVPYLANFLPMLGVLWFTVIFTRDEGGEFAWMIYYAGIVFALLVFGIVAVVLSAGQRPQTNTPNKASILTPDPPRVESPKNNQSPTQKSERALGQA